MFQDPFCSPPHTSQMSVFLLKPQYQNFWKDAGYCCALCGHKDVGFQFLPSSFRKIQLSVSHINCQLRVGDTNERRFLNTDSETRVFCHVCSPILLNHSHLSFGQIISEGSNEGSHGTNFLLQGLARQTSVAEGLDIISKGQLEICGVVVVCKLKSQFLFQATQVVVYSVKIQIPRTRVTEGGKFKAPCALVPLSEMKKTVPYLDV